MSGIETRRNALVASLAELETARRSADASGASTADIHGFMRRIDDVRREYVDLLARVVVARSPIDGTVVDVPLDVAGLDGPFWNADRPARRVEAIGGGFVVLTGSMQIVRDRLEQFAHLCLPGPDAPFVVPALLERDGVEAVISGVTVGPHLACAITYFSPRDHEPEPVPNEWGLREHWVRQRGEPIRPLAAYDHDPAPDFSLEPWIRRGKLSWVDPDDQDFALLREVDGCPFLQGGGTRFQRVQAGQIFS